MRLFIQILLILCCPAFSFTQNNPAYWESFTKQQADSLRVVWMNASNDTLRMSIVRSLAYYYMEINNDSSLYFVNQQSALAKRLNLRLWEADALDNMGYVSAKLKNYPQSLKAFLQGLAIAEEEETEKISGKYQHSQK
jgi:hypothetical protein